MDPLQLVLTGTFMEIAYFLFRCRQGSSRTRTAGGSP
jgi:hypothetical protein